MPKGMFTQGACILLDRRVTLDEIEKLLTEYDIRQRVHASKEWAFGGPTLVIAYQPERNGLVTVDVVDRQWPDHMGDAKNEPMVFGAWSMGHFGPLAYPGGLQRAAQQCWSWESGRNVSDRHHAFIRIRSSYVFGAGDNDPILPDDYESLPELEFVTKLAATLLDLPGALCYFNPNGEILRDRDGLRESLNYGSANDLPPFDAWSNVRLFEVNPEWTLMDTVGNGQLDIPDVEACFHSESFDLNEVGNFLRNVSLYVLNHGEVINDGDTMDGPGGIRWRSHQFKYGICDPPRRVLRWLPADDRPVPPEILSAGDPSQESVRGTSH